MPLPGHIYLDANATVPCSPRVLEAIANASTQAANPSSVHPAGAAARLAVETARVKIATALNADPDDLIFTGGGTESANIAIRGTVLSILRRRFGKPDATLGEILSARYRGTLAPVSIVATAIEHPCVLATVESLEAEGLARAEYVNPGTEGIVRADAFGDRIRSIDAELVIAMLANNETGAVQPVAEIARRGHDAGAIVFADAVQAVGKIPVDAGGLGVDLMSVSAHKFGGPKGVGALIVRGCMVARGGDRGSAADVIAGRMRLDPVIHGGGHEAGLRPGTLNVPGIVGMAAALEESLEGMPERMTRLWALTRRMRGDLAGVMPTTRFNTPVRPEDALPNTLNFTLPSWIAASGMDAHEAVRRFGERGVCLSAASACAAGRGVLASHVLVAQGLSEFEARNSLRVSFAPDAGTADVEAFFGALIGIAGGGW